MSFKVIASAALLLTIATPAFAEGGVVVTPHKIQAGNVLITEDRIEVPGVRIDAPQEERETLRNYVTPSNAQDFTNAVMDGRDFHGQDLRNSIFVNASAKGANFENANLAGADFTNADLDGANLNGANLEGADLTNATLDGAMMANTNLRNAKMTNVDMGNVITQAPPSVTKAAVIKDALTQKASGQPAEIDLTVNFDFNSDRLTAQGQAQVAQVASALQDMGKLSVLVQGHTDNVGSDSYNQNLSDRRAKAVVRELQNTARLGKVDLIARGYGESDPVDSNDSDLGRAKNRRVTLVNVTKVQ